MNRNGQVPREHLRWDAFKRNFTQSNYITDFWNWFMTLMSKAAEMFLFGTVLYSGYELLPDVPHVPPAIDAAVFVIQQGALDIGGMGLLKLARRAELSRDAFPVRLGIALVVLMIVNVALASIKHTLPMIPESVFVSIETVLLIARAVVAVLFGHAIHVLREEYSDSPITVHEASELQQDIQALAAELERVQQDFQQRLESQINLLTTRQGVALMTVKQEVETAIASLTPHLETLLQERLTVFRAEMRHSSVSPEAPETSTLRFLPSQKVSHSAVRPASETAGSCTHLARIYTLLNEDRSRKPADIQRLTGIPKATVYRLVERYHRENPVSAADTIYETEGDDAMSNESETAS